VKKSVYIETTIISYLAARPSRDIIRAARQTITRQWWDDRLQDFNAFISQLVIDEAGRGDSGASARRNRILSELACLDVSPEAIDLAAVIIEKGQMPQKASDDALHLAISAAHEIDFLVTWNCKHLANAEMLGRIGDVLSAEGYRVPFVCTPDELMGD
jgi:hypothetical protein